jgi:thiamine biosynthesis lipoprotein ApbE
MTQKANRRKREEGKETVFDFGGKLWGRDRIASTLARAEESRVSVNVAGEFHTIGLLLQGSVNS